MIAPFRGHVPRIDPSAVVVDSAVVIGDVELGAEASIWFQAVVRELTADEVAHLHASAAGYVAHAAAYRVEGRR